MRAVEIIHKKRRGEELSSEEIAHFVDGFVDGTIPDYQASALLMAICCRGMTFDETAALTRVMVESGAQVDLGPASAVAVDKHSTGGVGDKTTLVVAPLVAAAGIPVAKMSGRALGFSGGTIDKLESIPGLRVDLSPDEFRRVFDRCGLVISGQTADLAPADAKLYALRDVTATVDCLPLIASSIMSKKIAGGAQRIVLDVKVGSGAFMKSLDDATALAQTMVRIGERLDRKVVAVLSDMSQPLGRAVGNALEVYEAAETLRGNGPPDLWELCLTIGSHMLLLAGLTPDLNAARSTLESARASGAAFDKLPALVEGQGGNPRALVDFSLLPRARFVVDVPAPRSGYVAAIDAATVGQTVAALGAGRAHKGAEIDRSVGVVLHAKVGDQVESGGPLLTIHAATPEAAQVATREILAAYQWSATPVKPPPLIHGVVT